MKNYLIVGIGAGLGGMLRYWTSDLAFKFLPSTFPYGTLAVNVIGSFLIGVIIFYLNTQNLISTDFRLFLTVGLCGGLTTFSTFSLETINLLQDSEYYLSAVNILLNVLLTIAAVFLAFIISKMIIGGPSAY